MEPTQPVPPAGEASNSTLAPRTPPMTACETVAEMSEAIQSLEDYGLRLENDGESAMTADAVEQVLITDEWSCETCGRSSVPTCPASGKPHRRRLVRIAQDILRLVGRRVGKSYARPARLAERIDGKLRVRTQRHMAVNPQLLLLAFYFAAPSDSDTGGSDFVTECAGHLLDLLRQVKSYGRRVLAEMDEPYAKALLKSFYSAWKEYLKHANGEIAAGDQAEERVSADELFNGTRSALLAAAREAVRDPSNTDLKAFVALLYQRVKRLATKEQLTVVQAELEHIEQSPSPSPSTTFDDVTTASPTALPAAATAASGEETGAATTHAPHDRAATSKN